MDKRMLTYSELISTRRDIRALEFLYEKYSSLTIDEFLELPLKASQLEESGLKIVRDLEGFMNNSAALPRPTRARYIKEVFIAASEFRPLKLDFSNLSTLTDEYSSFGEMVKKRLGPLYEKMGTNNSIYKDVFGVLHSYGLDGTADCTDSFAYYYIHLWSNNVTITMMKELWRDYLPAILNYITTHPDTEVSMDEIQLPKDGKWKVEQLTSGNCNATGGFSTR